MTIVSYLCYTISTLSIMFKTDIYKRDIFVIYSEIFPTINVDSYRNMC